MQCKSAVVHDFNQLKYTVCSPTRPRPALQIQTPSPPAPPHRFWPCLPRKKEVFPVYPWTVCAALVSMECVFALVIRNCQMGMGGDEYR